MSRFSALKSRKIESEQAGHENTASITKIDSKLAGKRGNSEYRQFSAYLRADLYRQLKIRVAERDMDLSDAINDAVKHWLALEHGGTEVESGAGKQ